MLQENNGLVLEILKQDSVLKMGIFEQAQLALTLRHYSLCPVSFGEIDKLCEEAISVLNRKDKPLSQDSYSISDFKKTGQLLWDYLFTAQVKRVLENSANRDLFLIIDEELIGIPWELLYDGNEFLCLKFNLGRLVRTKEQKNHSRYRNLSGRLRMLILANPTNDLQSAYSEGVYIKNQFERKRKNLAIDFKSTHISTLYVKKNLRDYDIVHFAGHCEYDRENPANTGWVLSDGRLTVQDIHIMSQTLDLPTLIFSNACHSAKVVGGLAEQYCQQKAYSLASAFLFCGVRHYIGAIRRVEDQASLVFAKEFYAGLIEGRSVGESLRLGRIRLIKEYGQNSICWAGYLLYGDPAFSFFKPQARPASGKIKNNIFLRNRRLAWFLSALAVVSLSLCLYLFLPTLNPNTYILFFKSHSLFEQGKNQETVLSCIRIIEKDPLFLFAYPLLADTYHRMGDRSNALRYYYEYALLSERRQDKKNLSCAYIGLGWIYQMHGEYDKAFDFYNKATSLSRKNNDKLNEAKALRKLALWHIDKGESNLALELLMKSSEINRERQGIYEHKYNLACDYFDIGLVFVNKQDYAAARDFYTKSRILFEKLKLRNELSDYYFNLGEIYLFEKHYQQALDYYMKGLKIDLAKADKFKLADDYCMIGELYMAMNDLPEAQKFFDQASSIAKEADSPLGQARNYYNLAHLYKLKGEKNKSRDFLRQAQDIYRLSDARRSQQIKQEFLEY